MKTLQETEVDSSGWFDAFEDGKFVSEPSTASEHMDKIIFQAKSVEGYFSLLRQSGDLKHTVGIVGQLNGLEQSLKEFREFREANSTLAGKNRQLKI